MKTGETWRNGGGREDASWGCREDRMGKIRCIEEKNRRTSTERPSDVHDKQIGLEA
jgi:hypothetical protein